MRKGLHSVKNKKNQNVFYVQTRLDKAERWPRVLRVTVSSGKNKTRKI